MENRIAVFGAGGAIGQLLIKQAIEEGYKVNAYVRRIESFPIKHDRLKLFQGELDDFVSIKGVISGTNEVISTLGPPLKFSYSGMPISDGHRNIVKAMEECSVSRFITIATPSIKFEKDKTSLATVVPGIMARLIFPKPYKEIIEIGKIITASDLDWTIVRFLAPKNTAKKGDIKVTFGERKINFNISRADIAGFLFQQIADKTYIHSMPIIGS
ncbi:MAG: NAD(P)H-binding protein [Bacteroidales bacterium]|jgi:putative NADH-flavin reductase